MSYDFKHDDSILVLLAASGKENKLTIKVNGKLFTWLLGVKISMSICILDYMSK